MNTVALGSRRRFDFRALFLVLGALFVALFAGVLSAFLPWFLVVGFVVVVTAVLASTISPHVGLIFVLMLVFEVIPSTFQPRVPFGPGRLQIYDLALLLLSTIVLLRAWARGQQPLQAMGPVRWPLYYLFAAVSLSLVYVRFYAPNVMALAEARQQIIWLIVPVMALSVDTPRRYRQVLWSVAGIGLVIALYVTLQSLFDIRIMTGSRVESLDSEFNRDITRSIAGGGIYIVIFTLMLVLNRMFERRIGWVLGSLASFLLVAGLAAQYGRGVWIATVIGLLVSAAIFRGLAGAVRTTLAVGVIVAVVLSTAMVFKPRVAEALIDRITGIGAEFESGVSFGWRRQEIQLALPRIVDQPLTGVGIGGEYKQVRLASVGGDQDSTYIHNGYLYFPLKMGLWASFIPLAFVAAFVVTVRQGRARHGTVADAGFVAALCGTMVVPVITSYTQPEWSDPRGIAALATLMGLALLYRSHGLQSKLRPDAAQA